MLKSKKKVFCTEWATKREFKKKTEKNEHNFYAYELCVLLMLKYLQIYYRFGFFLFCLFIRLESFRVLPITIHLNILLSFVVVGICFFVYFLLKSNRHQRTMYRCL